MNLMFAGTLKKLREEKRMSQRELAEKMYVTRSTVVRWENGTRLPDAMMIAALSKTLDTDVGALIYAASGSKEEVEIIMVDDNRIVLDDSLSVLKDVMPDARIAGFIWPGKAIEYAKAHRVALALLDIELGSASGFDLSEELLKINSRTNVIFLTAYPDYSLDAWNTTASGFIVKPLTPEKIHLQLDKLRYPFSVTPRGEG